MQLKREKARINKMQTLPMARNNKFQRRNQENRKQKTIRRISESKR